MKILAQRGRIRNGQLQQCFEINGGGVSNTITTVQKDNLVIDMAKIYRIRKLTARECGRLMGVSDLDISKIQNYPLMWDGCDFVPPPHLEDASVKTISKLRISELQQYKMFGNSIVVNVLEAIFTQLFRADQDTLF